MENKLRYLITGSSGVILGKSSVPTSCIQSGSAATPKKVGITVWSELNGLVANS